MSLIVCGIDGANIILDNPDHGIQAAISLLDPSSYPDKRPTKLDSIPLRLELQFDDIERPIEDWVHPTMQDAQHIVDFITSTQSQGVNSFLFHCHMGKSRSAACGLLFCALNYGIENAKAKLLECAPRNPAPNTLMCEYFDQICGFDGKLAKLAWDFDFQMLKKLAQSFID